MVSCKFFYQETFCVSIYGEGVYILSYTNVLHANIFLLFMIWEQIYRFLCIFEIFVDPTHKVKYKGKQNYEKIQNSI